MQGRFYLCKINVRFVVKVLAIIDYDKLPALSDLGLDLRDIF